MHLYFYTKYFFDDQYEIDYFDDNYYDDAYDHDNLVDDDDVQCKISNICEDIKSATGSSQEAAGVGFDFKIFVASFQLICTFVLLQKIFL